MGHPMDMEIDEKVREAATKAFVPPKTPFLAVDLVIYYPNSESVWDTEIVVIERTYEPRGYALPGGFVDYMESVEAAALREAKEETSLIVEIDRLIGVYSDPKRDPRKHVVSCAYLARPLDPNNRPVAGDDAKAVRFVRLRDFEKLQWCFDHHLIMMAAADILKPCW